MWDFAVEDRNRSITIANPGTSSLNKRVARIKNRLRTRSSYLTKLANNSEHAKRYTYKDFADADFEERKFKALANMGKSTPVEEPTSDRTRNAQKAKIDKLMQNPEFAAKANAHAEHMSSMLTDAKNGMLEHPTAHDSFDKISRLNPMEAKAAFAKAFKEKMHGPATKNHSRITAENDRSA